MLPRTLRVKFALPMTKGFPYLDLFNYQLEKMTQSGLIEKLKVHFRECEHNVNIVIPEPLAVPV